jgi:uncharacterized protein YjbJ (UPF0337 family)
VSEIQILIDYHKEQVEEAIASNEYDAVALHNYLLGIAQRAQAQIQEIEPIWRAEISNEEVKGWKQEAIENLKESLDEAVRMTCEQVATDYNEQGF